MNKRAQGPDEKTKGGIYMIVCALSDRVYIGSSANLRRRWRAHIRQLRGSTHHCRHLQHAFTKHGEENFSFRVVERVGDALFLCAREQFWFWRFEGRLYNHSPCAYSVLGIKYSEEVRKRCAERMRGNTIKRGTKMPAGFAESVSKQMLGNDHRLGKPHSKSDRDKIAAGMKRAHAEGRRKPVDPRVSIANLAKWKAKLAAGEVIHPKRKPGRDAALIAMHERTGSLKKTGEAFGITPCAVWHIVKTYSPSQLRPRKKMVHGQGKKPAA